MRIRSRYSIPSLFAVLLCGLALSFAPIHAQAPVKGKPWVVPRTPDGKPDLQGNWSNETQTPLERMGKQGATLTTEQAAAIEERARVVEEFRDKASDPNRPPPAKGGDSGRWRRRDNRRSSSRSRKPPAARWAATTASGWIPATT